MMTAFVWDDALSPVMAGCVYRAYNSTGDLLYIGTTTNAKTRIQAHSRNALWRGSVARWRVRWHLTWEAAVKAEQRAIETEYPRWNITNRSRTHPDGSVKHWTELVRMHPQDVTPPLSPRRRQEFFAALNTFEQLDLMESAA